MSNTTRGNYQVTRETNLRCFDALPPLLREVLRNCLYDYATPVTLKEVRRGTRHDLLAESLVASDMRYARDDAKADWGVQRDAYLAAQPARRRRDYLDRPPRARL